MYHLRIGLAYSRHPLPLQTRRDSRYRYTHQYGWRRRVHGSRVAHEGLEGRYCGHRPGQLGLGRPGHSISRKIFRSDDVVGKKGVWIFYLLGLHPHLGCLDILLQNPSVSRLHSSKRKSIVKRRDWKVSAVPDGDALLERVDPLSVVTVAPWEETIVLVMQNPSVF
jgi:hypothetical protein